MNPSRETIAVALFNLFAPLGPNPGDGTFKTLSRRPALWSESTNMPSLYFGQPSDEYDYQHGTATPPFITLNFDGYLYINSSDLNKIPDTELNNLIDAIEGVLAPVAAPGSKQTLGGLVDHAWIDKPGIRRAPGYLDGQGMALFTIKVLVPA